MRIVTTTCSHTEIVCALGRADWLVGCDAHSDHPPEVVARLPRVGKDLDIDAEQVRALSPDLVLASLTVPGHDKVIARLSAAHDLNLFVTAPASLSDTVRDIRWLGRLLDAPEQAEALAAPLEAIAQAPAVVDGPRVLVEWWPKPPIVAGRQSWVEDLLRAAGAVNAFADDVKSAPLTLERARSCAPDAVVVSWCGIDPARYEPRRVLERPGWDQLPAVQNQVVVPISEAYLGRPGPRLLEGLDKLREVVARCR